MKFFLALLLSVVIYTTTSAQTGTVKGTVKQSDSTTAIPGAIIYLYKTTFGVISNSNGNYTLSDIPVGSYTLVISNMGYFTVRKAVTIKAGETITVSHNLIETVTELGAIIITSRAGIKDVPGSVQYISPKDLQKFSYTDINRTLRAVPGVNLQEEDGFGLRPNIGLRGTGSERSSKITLMEDGVLMAPAPYIAPSAYYFPTIGRMQGVEILKGSSQIKYGPYTTGGAINLISTQIPNEFSGRVNLLAGSFGSRNLHAYVGNSHKNIAYLVETFQYSADGFKELDGGGNTGFDKKDYLAKFRVHTSDSAKVAQSLTFKVGQSLETSNETYLGLTQADFDDNPYRRYAGSQKDQMNTEQTQYSVTHRAKFSKLFNITTTAYRSDFKRNWYKLDKVKDSTGTTTKISNLLDDPTGSDDAYDIIRGTSSLLSDALYVKANNRSYYAQGVQTVMSFNFGSDTIHHKIDIGFRIHQDQIDRFQWVDEYAMNSNVMELTKSGVHGTESNRVEVADAIATYIQYKLKIKKFTATPGLRYEYIKLARKDYGKADTDRTGVNLSERENTVDVIIPGVAFDYQFNPHLSSFVGVHKGFSPPGTKDETTPEASINYELGTRFTNNMFAGQAVIFYNDYSNLLGADNNSAGGTGSGDLFNGGEVESKGVEFQLTYNVLSYLEESKFNLPVSVSYTYTDATFQSSFDSDFEGWGTVASGDQLPYLAKNQFTISAGLEHKKFAVNISGRYSDEMRTSPGTGAIPLNEKTGAYFILDVSANYNLHKKVTLFATATNLTNKVYAVARRPSGVRPGMPTAFNVGLKANF